MGFQVQASVPALTVFAQGLLSFFSPCVLPLLPLYVGYLAGGTKVEREDGSTAYPRGKVMLNTLFFALGISAAFFLLGFGFTALGRFFGGNRIWFARISGIVVILFGLYQLGILGQSSALSQEHRLPFSLNKLAMNPLTALLLGFTFSFAWTPCVGPTLTSVLLMAGSSASGGAAAMLIGVYALGFTIPFLLVGLFTGTILDFFKNHMAVIRWTTKIGGGILILMGVMLLTGWLNSFTSYLSGAAVPEQTTPAASSSAAPPSSQQPAASQEPASSQQPDASDGAAESKAPLPPAPDFTLEDQYGEIHTLSDYQGKTVFLNFWATWCGPCQREMPDIQALYEQYGGNEEDLIVLGVANPKSDEYPHSNDKTAEEVTAFLDNGGYTYPVVMDASGEVFAAFGVSAFPTTFMIDTDGNIYGYAQGSLTAEMIESIVQQTMSGERD